MYQKNHSGGGNLPYSASPTAWYSSNYHHQPPNAAQFLDSDAPPPQHMYHYPPHMLPPQPSPDWVSHDNYASSPQNGSLLQSSGGIGNGPGSAAFLTLNQAAQNGASNEHLNDALPNLPSPPATVHSGSDMSSPGALGPSSSPQNSSRPTPVKSPYEWMKKPSYQSQPNPGRQNSHSSLPLAAMHSYVLVSNLILKISDSQFKRFTVDHSGRFYFNFMQFQITNNLRLIYDTSWFLLFNAS